PLGHQRPMSGRRRPVGDPRARRPRQPSRLRSGTARASPMTPAILRARGSDAADLTRISRAAKRYWGYPEKLIRLWQRDLTVTPGFIERHPVYRAVHRGKAVGFYAVYGTGSARELEHMWVHPKYIGAGVGRALFGHLLRRLRTMEVMRLDVASDPNAEGFYRRMGTRRGRVV